jgi:sodium pump decarboxylase gamma subunit
MIAQGFGLLAAGMGMVFAFLILLVFVMKGSARLFRHLPTPSLEKISASAHEPAEPAAPSEVLAEIAAAIAAAQARSRIRGD